VAGNYPCCCNGGGGGGGSTGTECYLCSSGYAPTYFNVVVSGWADSGSYPASCQGWCSTMNGTYVVNKNGRGQCLWGDCFDITDSPFVDNGFGANVCDPVAGGILNERWQSLGIEIGFNVTFNEIYVEFTAHTVVDDCVGGSTNSEYWYYTIPGSNPYDCETYLGTTRSMTRLSGGAFTALCDPATSVTIEGVYV